MFLRFLYNLLLVLVACICSFSSLKGQTVTVWSEDFSGYPNGTFNNAPVWTTTYVDIDDVGINSGGNFWGVYNGEFRCNDIEGNNSDCINEFITQPFSIQCLQNVSIRLNARSTGTLECGGGPNSHDEIRAYYALNGGAWIQFAYVCGSNGLPSVLSVNGLSGNTIALKITMGNKSNDENYYIDNILVTGDQSVHPDAGPDLSICPGGNVTLQASGGGTYQWSPAIGLSCTACPNPVASPSSTQQYILTATNNGCSGTDTVIVNVVAGPAVNLGNDTSICAGQNLVLDATYPGATYAWQNGVNTPTFTVTGPGTYHVTVSQGNCITRDTIQVVQVQFPVVNLGNDTLVCGNLNIMLDAGNPGSSYAWNNGATTQAIQAQQPGLYIVVVNNACGSNSGNVLISSVPLPVADLGPDQSLCTNPSINLNAGNSGDIYLWSTGSTQSNIVVQQPGTYSVLVSNQCGTAFDEINIGAAVIPVVDLGPDQTICGTEMQLLLDAGNPGSSYHWNNGNAGQQLMVQSGGTYYVMVTNDCGTSTDTIEILQLFPPVDIFDNVITAPCGATSLRLDAKNPGAGFVWNTGDTTAFIMVTEPGTYWVDIQACDAQLRDSVLVRFIKPGGIKVFTPTAFTPNNDGVNDMYGIGGLFEGMTSFRAEIFNRWGESVYHTENPHFLWDGLYHQTEAPPGIYVLKIFVGQECGDVFDIERTEKIYLIR